MSARSAIPRRPYFRVGGGAYYGQHLMVSAYGCSEVVLDEGFVKSFMSRLADRINMVRWGEPVAQRFGGEHPDDLGISGVQLITTSAITVHTNDLHRDLFLDVFSCRQFSNADTVAFVREELRPEACGWDVVWRA